MKSGEKKKNPVKLAKTIEFVLLCYDFWSILRKQNYKEKKEWGGLEAWAKGFKTIISETESRAGSQRSLSNEKAAELGNTQWGGASLPKRWRFSSWVQVPRCGYGKDRCVSKPTAAVLTGECKRRANREKNLLGRKRDGAGNPFPRGRGLLGAHL